MLIGTLADKPVIRFERNKIELVGLFLMTQGQRVDANAKKMINVEEYHRIVVTHKSYIESALDFEQGSLLYIEGALHTHFWQDQLFEWRSLTSIMVWQDSDKVHIVDGTETTTSVATSNAQVSACDFSLIKIPQVA